MKDEDGQDGSRDRIVRTMPVNLETHKIDIGREAKKIPTYSDGDIEEVDKDRGSRAKWFRERVIVVLAAGTIMTILVLSAILVGFSRDAESLDWARQSLTALLGFAAGAIFTNTGSKGK